MFRRIINKVIEVLSFITNNFIRAYNETYNIKDLDFEFQEEVKKRKKKNKKKSIERLAKFEIDKNFFFGKLISKTEALKLGKNTYNIAKSNGCIDELNNLRSIDE